MSELVGCTCFASGIRQASPADWRVESRRFHKAATKEGTITLLNTHIIFNIDPQANCISIWAQRGLARFNGLLRIVMIYMCYYLIMIRSLVLAQ